MLELFNKKTQEEFIAETVKSIDAFKKRLKEVENSGIETVWNADNNHNLLLEMNAYLAKKCSYGDEIEKLSASERIYP